EDGGEGVDKQVCSRFRLALVVVLVLSLLGEAVVIDGGDNDGVILLDV
ncbi:unnamed protein product, partial [Didymodactylos carnosus]